jgi:hypothetical protein
MWGTRDWFGVGASGAGSAYVGRKEIFSEWVWFDTEKTIEGLRPSFSSHVRCCERGAPVRFPPGVANAIGLFGSDMGGLIDKLEAYRHEPEG